MIEKTGILSDKFNSYCEEIKNKCQTCTVDSKNKLKFGDKILIETSGNITLETSDYEYLDISREWHKSSKTFIYTIIMNDNAEEIIPCIYDSI